MADHKLQIEASLDASGVESGVSRADRSLQSLIRRIDDATAATKAGGKQTAEYFEAWGKSRGLNPDALRPHIDALKAAQEEQKRTTTGLADMTSAAHFAAKALATIGIGVSFAEVVGRLKDSVKFLEEFKDAAEIAGSTVETMGKLMSVAAAKGMSLQEVTSLTEKLNRSLLGAEQGTSKAAAAFKAMGLDLTKFADSGEALITFAERLNTYADGAAKSQLAIAALGKSGAAAIPYLKDLADSGDRVATITAKQAAEADEFSKALGRLAYQSKLAVASFVSDWIPALNEFIQKMLAARAAGLGLLESLGTASGLKGKDAENEINKVTAALDKQRKLLSELESMSPATRKINDIVFGDEADLRRGIKLNEDRLQELRKVIAATKQYEEAMREMQAREAAEIGPKQPAPQIEETTKAIEKQSEEVKRWLALGKEYKTLTDEIVGITSKFSDSERGATEAQRAFNKAQAEGKLLGLPEQWVAQYRALVDLASATELAAKAEQARYAILQNTLDANAKELGSVIAQAEAADKRVQSLMNERDQIGLTTDELLRLELQRIDENIAMQETLRAVYEMDPARTAEVAAIDRTIDALKREKEVRSEIASKTIDAEAAKASSEAWRKSADDINRSLTDAFFRAAESGKSFFVTLRDAIKGIFSNLVIKPILQAGVASVTSAIGLPSIANAGTSGLGALSSLGSLAGAGTLLGGLGNGLSAWGAGGSVMGVLENPGLYSMAELAGAVAPIAIPLIIAGLALTGALEGGETRSGSAYGYSRAGGSTASMSSIVAHANAGGISSLSPSTVTRLVGPSGGSINGATGESAAAAIVNTTIGSINSFFDALGSTNRIDQFWAKLETSTESRGGVLAGGLLTGGQRFGFGDLGGSNYAGNQFDAAFSFSPDAKTAAANFATELKRATLDALQEAFSPEVGTLLQRRVGEILQGVDLAATTTDDALNALLVSIQNEIDGYKSLTQVMDLLGLSLGSLKLTTVDAAGGFANVSATMAAFYDVTRSDAEKFADAQNALSSAFGALGQSMPQTIAAYRAAVEQAFSAGNDTLGLSLAGLAPAFGALAQQADALGLNLDGTAKTIEDAAVGVAQAAARLEGLGLADLYDEVGLATEATAIRTQSLTVELGKVGLQLPTTIEQLQALVRSATPEQAAVLGDFADALLSVVDAAGTGRRALQAPPKLEGFDLANLYERVGLAAEATSVRAEALQTAFDEVGLTLPGTVSELRALVLAASPQEAAIIAEFADALVSVVTAADAAAAALRGPEKLMPSTSDWQQFVDRFVAPTERAAFYGNQLAASFSTLGQVMPQTADEFVALVNHLYLLSAAAAGTQESLDWGDTLRQVLGLSDDFQTWLAALPTALDDATTALSGLEQAASSIGNRDVMARFYESMGVSGQDLRAVLRDMLEASWSDLLTSAPDWMGRNAPLPGSSAEWTKYVETADATGNTALRDLLIGLAQLSVRITDLGKVTDTTTGDVADAVARLTGLDLAALYEKVGMTAEATAVRTQTVTDALDALGFSLPTTREELQAIVRSASPEQAAVLAQYADALLLLTGTAADGTDQLASARLELEGQILQATGNVAEIRRRELEGLDESLRPLQQTLYDLADAADALAAAQSRVSAAESAVASAQSRIDAVRSQATAAYQTALSAVDSAQSRIDSLRQQATARYISAQNAVAAAQQRVADAAERAAQRNSELARTIRDYLTDLAGSGSTTSPSAALAAARARLQGAAASALGGDTTAAGTLTQLAQQFLDASKAGSKTGAQYAADELLVRRLLGQVQTSLGPIATDTATANDEISDAMADLAVAQQDLGEAMQDVAATGASTTDQLSSISQQFSEAQTALAIAQTDAAKALSVVQQVGADLNSNADDILAEYQSASRELVKATQELASATSALAAAQVAQQKIIDDANDQVTGTTGAVATATDVIAGATTSVTTAVDAIGDAATIIDAGTTITDAATVIADAAATVADPVDTTAATPDAIDTSLIDWSQFGTDMTVLVNEIKSLRSEVIGLRADKQSADTTIANNTRRAADALEKWDVDGLPAERV